ncbi:MAG TPA: hypothetical protein VLC48_06270 [Gemmatimonadota bacterium]|nr:hypothetical protein [Gemmatimonadota bacterium]
MIVRTWTRVVIVAAAAVTLVPASSAAQLPFAVTQNDLASVDTTAFHWRGLAANVGGVEGELRYAVASPPVGECRAVATLGMFRLRNYYMKSAGERPVTLKLQLRCGDAYRGRVDYDGVNTSLELTNHTSGALLYRGSIRGLP